jgi:hypothetical protein
MILLCSFRFLKTNYFVNSANTEVYKSRFEKSLTRKVEVETGFIWKPSLYVGLSFRPRGGGLDKNEVNEKIRSWTNRLASYGRTHIIFDGVYEWAYSADYDDWIYHGHGVVLSEKAIATDLAKGLWKEGLGSFRKYDNSLGGVVYNHMGHEDTYLINRVACSKRSGACRRNRCPYQKDGELTRA